MTKYFDIVIIGGGLVGASLALALKDSPFSVTIVEASPERELNANDVNARSIALSYSSKQIFSGLGVWEQMQAYTTPIHHIHISDRGHFGATRIHANEQSVDALGYSIQAQMVGKSLYDVLTDGVTWLRPATMKAIDLNNKSLTVETEQGEQTITTQLVIAADGNFSKTRELLNIKTTTTDYDQSAVVANITLDRKHGHKAYERFTEAGPIALLPVDDNHMALVWTATHEQVKQLVELDEPTFLEQLQTEFGHRAGRFIAASKRMMFPLNLIESHEQVREGLIILGNAAHALHPVAAQGFNLALRDVAELAEVLVAAEDAKDLGHQQRLQAYADARQCDQEQTIHFTDTLLNIFSNELWPLTPIRGLSLAVLDNVSPLKKWLAKRAMGFRGKASRLARGLTLK